MSYIPFTPVVYCVANDVLQKYILISAVLVIFRKEPHRMCTDSSY